jgi:hypothetical protein
VVLLRLAAARTRDIACLAQSAKVEPRSPSGGIWFSLTNGIPVHKQAKAGTALHVWLADQITSVLFFVAEI